MSDWIEWNGGKCPVEKGTPVEVKSRLGEVYCGMALNDSHDLEQSFWDHDNNSADIIAYRLYQAENELPLTQQLTHAVKKRDKHRAKLDKWSGEVERLKGELEREIESATGMGCRIGDTDTKPDEIAVRLGKLDQAVENLRRVFCAWDQVGVPSGSAMRVSDDESGGVWQHPNGDTSPVETVHAVGSKKTDPVKGATTWPIPEGLDPDDPATWKAGDVVECVRAYNRDYTFGKEYEAKFNDGSLHVIDDAGCDVMVASSRFRVVRRPS